PVADSSRRMTATLESSPQWSECVRCGWLTDRRLRRLASPSRRGGCSCAPQKPFEGEEEVRIVRDLQSPADLKRWPRRSGSHRTTKRRSCSSVPSALLTSTCQSAPVSTVCRLYVR